ncbi:MAG TPA: thioesterase family protein [Anaerolineales bacterium]|nr:thioesterase family protein [Anaerolineales bacterium]
MTPADLHVGDIAEDTQEVTAERTASHIGSGALRVYATPAMALFVEQTCRRLAERSLPAGKTTVGVELHLRHLAPTPMGGTVRIRVELVGLEAEALDFEADVWDELEKVGEAEHRRRVIAEDRFLRRVEAKARRKSV